MQENLNRFSRKELKAVTDGIQVHIEKHCWTKMHGWCRAAGSEVSGVGLADLKDGKFVVSDVYLPKQQCSSSYTDIDDAAMGKLNYKMFKKGNESRLRFWWHTHYNFNTFWSGTDDDTAQKLMKTNGEWELSLVINQRGDWLCRMDMMSPFNITVDNLPVFLVQNSKKQKKRYRSFKTDIKKWVRPMSYSEPRVTIPHVERQGMNEDAWWEMMQGMGSLYSEGEQMFTAPTKEIISQARQEKIEDERARKDVMQKREDGSIAMGKKYTWFNGKLMTIEAYEKLKECQCDHENVISWEQCTCAQDCHYCCDRLSDISGEMVGRC